MEGGKKQSQVSPSGARRQWAAAVGGGSGVAADETVMGLYITGDRVKTDARDAEHLAKLLRLGQIVEVIVPSVEAETVRDVVLPLLVHGC